MGSIYRKSVLQIDQSSKYGEPFQDKEELLIAIFN